jgi:hypothetical protein
LAIGQYWPYPRATFPEYRHWRGQSQGQILSFHHSLAWQMLRAGVS